MGQRIPSGPAVDNVCTNRPDTKLKSACPVAPKSVLAIREASIQIDDRLHLYAQLSARLAKNDRPTTNAAMQSLARRVGDRPFLESHARAALDDVATDELDHPQLDIDPRPGRLDRTISRETPSAMTTRSSARQSSVSWRAAARAIASRGSTRRATPPPRGGVRRPDSHGFRTTSPSHAQTVPIPSCSPRSQSSTSTMNFLHTGETVTTPRWSSRTPLRGTLALRPTSHHSLGVDGTKSGVRSTDAELRAAQGACPKGRAKLHQAAAWRECRRCTPVEGLATVRQRKYRDGSMIPRD